MAAHDAARARLLERAGTTEIRRHDEARVDLTLEVERATAVETRLEQALAAARDAWPAREAAFSEGLRRAAQECAEGSKTIKRLIEKVFPGVADDLDRLKAIDQHLHSLQDLGRYLDRVKEIPDSPNRALRAAQPPLYADGALSPEVVLPGATHTPIWPRPRTAPAKANAGAES